MNEQIQRIDIKDTGVLRNELISALQFDLNGNSGDVDKILEQVDINNSDLWQSLEGELDEDNYTEDYLNEQMVELSYNFAKERFDLCQKIGKELFPVVMNNVELEAPPIQALDEELPSRSSSKKWILLLVLIVLMGVTWMIQLLKS